MRPDNPDSGGTLASAFLLAGGLLALPPIIALARLLREREPDFALLAGLLAADGAIGAAVHGGYDLANAVNPPDRTLDLPSQVDPRGLLTFGFAALGLLGFAGLLRRSASLPRSLAPLAAALGALLVAIYVGRLVVLDADSPAIVAPAAVAGFVLSPLWYARVGVSLRSRAQAAATAAPDGSSNRAATSSRIPSIASVAGER